MRCASPTSSGRHPTKIPVGLSVFAIDGSKYRLPAADALRKAFDPDSGLDHPGQGHYPQCLVSTVYDVFRRLPIARTVQSIAHANEREEVKVLLPQIPLGGVLLFDRGYPSYDLIDYLLRRYRGLLGHPLSRRRHLSRRQSFRAIGANRGDPHPNPADGRTDRVTCRSYGQSRWRALGTPHQPA